MPGTPPGKSKSNGEKNTMKDIMLKLYVKAQNFLSADEGQDLVEYALVIALIALAATAGMKTLASDISAAFSTVGTTLNADV
jgi:pilus assembly protein Flp/PilA